MPAIAETAGNGVHDHPHHRLRSKHRYKPYRLDPGNALVVDPRLGELPLTNARAEIKQLVGALDAALAGVT